MTRCVLRTRFAAVVVAVVFGGGLLRAADDKPEPMASRQQQAENDKLKKEWEKRLAEFEKLKEEHRKKWQKLQAEWEQRRAEWEQQQAEREEHLRRQGIIPRGESVPLGLAPVPQPLPPLLANLRGEVTDVAGELLTVSIGIDAGLAVGTVLDVYRTSGGGKYLGTIKVTSALNLFPKQAIVTFTPANRNIPFDRLPEGDLPKKGDLVQAPNATTGGR